MTSSNPVQLAWTNQGTQSVLYTGSQGNTITLTLSNTTSGIVKIPSAATAALTICGGSMFGVQQTAQIPCSPAGWTATCSAEGTLSLTPTQSFSLTASGVAITLTGLQAGSYAGTYTGSAQFNYALGSADAASTCTQLVTVTLEPPPPAGLKPLQVVVGLMSDRVVAGEPQTLRLFLANGSGEPVTWSGGAPAFTLTANIGSGANALLAASAQPSLTVLPAINSASDWSVTPVTSEDTLTWTITPAATAELGAGTQATTVFQLSGLTNAVAGLSTLNFGWGAFAGYAGQSVPLAVEKVPVPPPAPAITAFTADPPTIDLRSGSSTVTLSYTVSGAANVAILGVGIFAVDATGSGSVTVDLAESTLLTLVARNATGQSATASLTVTVSPSLFEMLPVGSIVMWNGDPATPPEGWVACVPGADPGVPNLADSFIQASPTGAGLVPIAATDHSHSVTTLAATTGSANCNDSPNHLHTVGSISWSNIHSCWTSFSVRSAGNHFHGGVTGLTSTGSPAPSIRPAWP